MCNGNYVFQPGDIVQRKDSELDSTWCRAMAELGKEPTAPMVVKYCRTANTEVEGMHGVWGTWTFNLVRRAQSPSTPASVVPTIAAHGILQNAAAEMLDRAASRDTPKGERSMGRCVKAFNAMFGTELTETQGWQFMELLKMARSVGGEFRLDDYTDGVAYAALAGECASRSK